MVKIKINGKEVEGREFQNMPQALAFAFQNGNCHIAEKLELISSEPVKKEEPVTEPVKTEEATTAETTEPVTEPTTEPVTEPVKTEE